MSFILKQMQQLGMVVLVMISATGGTVGILKLIKRFAPGTGFPQDSISQERKEK